MLRLFSRLGVVSLLLLCWTQLSSADQPLKPADWAPQYSLGTPQMKTNIFGRSYLSLTFRRIKSGRGFVRLRARGPSGPVTVSGVQMDLTQKDSGELLLSPRMGIGFWRSEKPDIEFYVVSDARMAGESHGEFLVSNVVQMGDPGPATTARQWDDRVRAANDKESLAKVPPVSIAEGHQGVNAGTKLVPGMPIKVGYYGDWVDAEVVALKNDGQVGVMRGSLVRYYSREKWLSVHPDILARAESNPGEFAASVRLLPGGTKPLPSDAVAIDPGLKLPGGTPVLRFFGSWNTNFVVQDLGGRVKVIDEHRLDFFGLDKALTVADEVDRSSLAIREETLVKLKDPAARQAFAENLKGADEAGGMARDRGLGARARDAADAFNDGLNEDLHVVDRSYPINISLPKRAVTLPKDVTLPEETIVAYCWGRKWEPAEVVRDDGEHVLVRKLDSITGFVYRIDRDQLIIQPKTLRVLGRGAARGADLAKTLRTWTDATGKHKVEARFVEVKDGKVKLKTDAGREITLPLDRLSSADQELLSEVQASADSPFE